MSTEQSNIHRVVVEFDDGIYIKQLIHPESCVGSDRCAHCAADLTDAASTRCYDCKDEGPQECWIQGWFDNSTPDELLHGLVVLEIDSRWEFDHMEAHVVGAAMPVAEGRSGGPAVPTEFPALRERDA